MGATRVCSVLLLALVSCAEGGLPPGEPASTAYSPAPDSLAPDSESKLVAVKLLTPEIKDASERWLREFYSSPVGTKQRVVVTGRPLLFVLTWHYHPPGYVGAPTGKHKGVTVFEEE